MPSFFSFSKTGQIHPASSLQKSDSGTSEEPALPAAQRAPADLDARRLLDALLGENAAVFSGPDGCLEKLALKQSLSLAEYLLIAKVEEDATEEFLKPLSDDRGTKGCEDSLRWNFDLAALNGDESAVHQHAKNLFTSFPYFNVLPVDVNSLDGAIVSVFLGYADDGGIDRKVFVLQVLHSVTLCALHIDADKVQFCPLDVFVLQIAVLLHGYHAEIPAEHKTLLPEHYEGLTQGLLERMYGVSKGLDKLAKSNLFQSFSEEIQNGLYKAIFTIAVKLDHSEHLGILRSLIAFPNDEQTHSLELRESALYGLACAAASSHICKPYAQIKPIIPFVTPAAPKDASMLGALNALDLLVIPQWVAVAQILVDLDEPYGHLLVNRSQLIQEIRAADNTETIEGLQERDEAFHETYKEFETGGDLPKATGATYLQRFISRIRIDSPGHEDGASPLPSPPPLSQKIDLPTQEGKLVQLAKKRTEKVLETKRKSTLQLLEKRQVRGKLSDGLELILMRRRTKLLFLILTLFVLFGDDVRLLVLPPSADIYFGIVTTICFFIFSFELAATCYIRKDYKFSFFFWLDVIALVSLLPDIPIFYDYLLLLLQEESSSANGEGLSVTRASKASRAGARAARIVRILRVVRLLRLLKVYELFYRHRKEQKMIKSYGSKYAKQFIRKRSLTSQHDLAHMSEDALALLPESKVGARLADLTTQKVILIVLLMLFSGPIFSDTTVDLQYASSLGLLHSESIRFKNNQSSSFLSMLEDFKNATPSLLLLKMTVVSKTELVFGSVESNEDRYRPIQLIYEAATCKPCNATTYIPFAYCFCEPKEESYAIFDNSAAVFLSSQKNILQTCFIMLLLGAGTFGFSYDINKIVIAPVESMVNLVNELKANPLADFSKRDVDSKAEKAYETKLLENTIKKIGGLLRVGFGEAGTRLIADNLNRDGELDPMAVGRSVKAIFGYVRICQVDTVVKALGKESMILVNEVANIVHKQASKYKGSAIRNSEGGFLIAWVPSRDPDLEETQLADMALLSFVKIILDFNVHEGLQALNDPKDPLAQRILEEVPDFKLSLSFALHTGRCIEGLVGSVKKLDVSYLSPHVALTKR